MITVSSLLSSVRHEAFCDEFVKIAEMSEKDKKKIMNTLKAVGVISLASGLGYASANALDQATRAKVVDYLSKIPAEKRQKMLMGASALVGAGTGYAARRVMEEREKMRNAG